MVPKILLLVNLDPSSSGIGELFIREIGKVYPADRLVRFSTVQRRQAVGESVWLGFRSLIRYIGASRWPFLSTISELSFKFSSVDSMTKEIISVVEHESIDLIWVVLSSVPIIALADQLSLQSRVPIISTVWDDPEYFAKNRHLDPFTRAHLYKQFQRVLSRSRRVSVIGESMQAIYRVRYGVDSVIMRHGVEESAFKDWLGDRSKEQIIRIGFAGSLYAKKEWNALIRMLDSVNGCIVGKNVRVSFVGRWPRTGVNNSRYVDKLGPMSFECALNVLRQSDIAYLPYWFDKRHSMIVKTSFPGKLSTYAACGIPVLYHGPLDSSVTPFLQKYPFGVCCHSLKEDVIYDSILKILENKDFHNQASHARDQALENELGRLAMLRRFCELVDCDQTNIVTESK